MALSARYTSTKPAIMQNTTKLNETPKRYGGQNSVTMAWLWPTSSASATASAPSPSSQNTLRMAPPCL
ncbi:hypothetical protein D9M68_939210 [compost metagenome]